MSGEFVPTLWAAPKAVNCRAITSISGIWNSRAAQTRRFQMMTFLVTPSGPTPVKIMRLPS